MIEPGTLRKLVILAILLTWEILPRLELVHPALLAPFSSTLLVGVAEFGTYAQALAVTFWEMALGLVIAYGFGGVVGLLFGTIRPLGRPLLPILSSIYAIPFVVIYPVLTAWVGIGPESKVLFAGLYGFFPMALATAAGVQTVDRTLVVAARSMGASRRQILVEVVVPSAIPSIVSGLRIGGALVAIGVVVAEMLAATAGIGFLITQNRTMFRTPEVYFGILLVLVIAGALDWSIGRLERATGAWHPKRGT